MGWALSAGRSETGVDEGGDGVGHHVVHDLALVRAHGLEVHGTLADADALASALAGELRGGDQVICLGAGDITKWAAGLAPAIEARR